MIKEEFINRYEDNKKYQKAIVILDNGYEDADQFFNEPIEAHIHIRKTNVLERLNSEVRRREHTIRILPINQSAFRLIRAVLMDYHATTDSRKKNNINFQDQ